MDLFQRFEQNKSLSQLSTFGIGGPAKFYIQASEIAELQEIIRYAYREQIPFIVLGKGSNCLFDDRGFEGLVIGNKISFFKQEGNIVSVGSGYSFSLLGVQTARNGWSGLEFASGIPASVGGAIYMNAGANGTETCEALKEIIYVSEQGAIEVYLKEQIAFGYRYSSFHEKKGAIAAAKFQLTPSDQARTKQLGIVEYRTKTQPYSEKSAGCVFRNPEQKPAGALIDQCGLKGLKVGGAEVSARHGNFIVNRGEATAQDVQELAQLVKSRVKEETGIDLQLEIRVIPHKIT